MKGLKTITIGGVDFPIGVSATAATTCATTTAASGFKEVVEMWLDEAPNHSDGSYDALLGLPGYWRGRAQTRRAMAALEPVGFEQDRHLKLATEYEKIADGDPNWDYVRRCQPHGNQTATTGLDN